MDILHDPDIRDYIIGDIPVPYARKHIINNTQYVKRFAPEWKREHDSEKVEPDVCPGPNDTDRWMPVRNNRGVTKERV